MYSMALAIFWWFLSSFSPCKKNFGPKNNFFGDFSNTILSQKSVDLNRFLMKFPFSKCILSYVLLHWFSSYVTNNFHKTYNFARVTPSLRWSKKKRKKKKKKNTMPWGEAEGNSVVLRAPRTYDLTMTRIKCSQGFVLSCLSTNKDSRHLFC